jgi:hypothetical protein
VRGLILTVAVFATLAALISTAHRHTDAWAPPSAAGDEIRYLPSGDSLKAASLGFETLIADLLWVKAVLLFGDRFGDGDDSWYPWLFHMTDLATELDPEFRAAYKMGGTMLRTGGAFVDQSSLIFQKGMNAMPDEWYFPFAIGMNYHMYKDDPRIAARFMRQAAETGDGPMYLRNLAASLLRDSNQLEVALQFLLEELNNLPPGSAREVTMVKVYEVRYEIAKRDADAAIAAYRDQEGHLPKTPQDIGSAGFVLPVDPITDTSYLATLRIPPPARVGWIWNPSPDAKPGTVVSDGFELLFFQIARTTGYGGRAIRAAPE